MDFELSIETEHVEERIEDFCNVLVSLRTGEASALNVWTFAVCRRPLLAEMFARLPVRERRTDISPDAEALLRTRRSACRRSPV